MCELGIKCASVVVNGKTRFDLGPALGRVLLEGPMDAADVRAVLTAEIRRTAGQAAPVLPAVPQVSAARQSENRDTAGKESSRQ